MQVKAGTTSFSIDVFIADNNGAGVTGLTYATVLSNIPSLAYSLGNNTAATAITPVSLASITTAWTSSGFIERGQGTYRFDLPNAALATAAKNVKILGDADGYHIIADTISVVAFDPQDAIHLGLSAVGWSTLTSSITTANSIGKRILDFVTTLVYAAPLTQANVRTAIGMASANLDTQLAGLPSASTIATAVATAILITPANKIATDGSNRVSVDQTGYALSTDALTAVAAAVEAAILDDSDGEAVLAAIVAKINSVDADLSGLSISAIASAVQTAIERAGGTLKLVQAQTDKIGTNAGDSPNANTAFTAAGNAATNTTELPNMITGTGETAAFTQTALENGPTGSGGGSSAPGGFTVGVATTDGTDPLGSATVIFTQGQQTYSITSDAAGLGASSFALTAGTYTVAAAKDGYLFDALTVTGLLSWDAGNGALTVTGAGSVSVSLSANSLQPSNGPTDCRIYFTTYGDDANTIVDGATFSWRIVSSPTAGASFDGAKNIGASVGTEPNNAFIDAPQGATIAVRRGLGAEQMYVVPSQSTSLLPSLIGIDA